MSSPDAPTPAPDAEVTRRLARLQRILTQSLVAADPLSTLLRRLKTTCNATVAIIDRHGDAAHATGAMPLNGLYHELADSTDETQKIEFEGWRGLAERLYEGGDPQSHVGWMVALSRRPTFPNPYESAAVQLGAALVETCERIGVVARQQELAIRAATLEEALAFRPTRDDPTLLGRLTSLGLRLDDEIRVAVVTLTPTMRSSTSDAMLASLTDAIRNALGDYPIHHLVSARGGYLVAAFEATTATFKRAITASSRLPECRIGVGRPVREVADFNQSLNDAELALQTMRPSRRGVHLLAYEDFDLATRLFADAGLDQMGTWARHLLAPVLDRPPLIQGLHAYFRHGQNINAAARELHIHHNSLRYRLAKVEQTLSVALHDPATIASVFLALRALELERFDFHRSPAVAESHAGVRDVTAPHRLVNTDPLPSADGLGVARSPRPR